MINTINALFSEKPAEDELAGLLAELKRKRYITVKDGNISYQLPEKA